MHGRSPRSTTITTFRVHFTTGHSVDVDAANPNQARDIARDRNNGGIVTKVKIVKAAK